jgi:hypothetical protein
MGINFEIISDTISLIISTTESKNIEYNYIFEFLKFATPIFVAAISPVLLVFFTYWKDKKEMRNKYNEKRINNFLSLCADYISVGKALMNVYDDNAEEKIATQTTGIRIAEVKLRLLSYFPIDSNMRKQLNELSSELENITFMFAKVKNEDVHINQKKDTAISLSEKIQALYIKLETLFIERERQLRSEFFGGKK